MRKLIVNTMLSLDGVMQLPGGPDETRPADSSLGGWGATYVDEEMMSRVAQSACTSCCSAAGPTRSSPRTGPTTRARSPTNSTGLASTSPRPPSTPWHGTTPR